MYETAEYVQALAVPGVSAMLLAMVFKLVRYYISRLEDERLRALLRGFVKAAEQIYGPGKGVAKRRYVQERIQQRDLGQVGRDEIEAAVYDLHSDKLAT